MRVQVVAGLLFPRGLRRRLSVHKIWNFITHAQRLFSLRAMGNNLLIAHRILSCHILGHLGVANHIDPWFYDVIDLKHFRSVAIHYLLLSFLALSSSSIKIKQARISSFMLPTYWRVLTSCTDASVWTPHDKKPMFEPLYHSDDLWLK